MTLPSGNSSTPLCSFDSVCKWYGSVIGLNDVSWKMQPGITGLVGHNGAGKSTLIKLLTGQLQPSLGSVSICGHRAWSAAAKRHLGYCPDVDAFYEEMSGQSFVRMMARLHGFSPRAARERTNDVLQQVGMTDRANRPLASYSKGMRQRIKLAQALVHDPDLIVLDEPLNGVDPVGRYELIELFRSLAAQGKAILISSHILEEMDTLASRILFICRGRLLASGTLTEIRALLDSHPLKIRIATPGARELAAELLRMEVVRSVAFELPNQILLEVLRPKEFFGPLAELVTRHGHDLQRLQVIDATTEAIFDYLMQAAHQHR
jgi:ABC-2 type transport system ATP-binding protein